jgi:predicted nucleic acid-binding protein
VSDSTPDHGKLVVDNSVMMRWLFDDGSRSDRRYAADILETINESQCAVLVPCLWVYESAFVVNYYVERGEIEKHQGARHLSSLYDLCCVATDKQPPAVLFEFSHLNGISAYDSGYIILAQSQRLPIATLDRKMRKVSVTLGVELF